MKSVIIRCAFLLLFASTTTVSGRAVNISNTWVLPEEGFPVFYRYFRDRISWYEADAVCQFHHANLVIVDSTSQYDAVRAYLKELDISHNVWIGLSRTSEKPNFTWTDFRPLSGEGYWQEAIPAGGDPLCAAMDPAADFWWKAMPCGAPTVASFICELSVPSWAMGPTGCLLTELPSLTVLYNPEQSAIELTSDCGLDGTKRIACKGNVDREEIMRQLTCTISGDDFDDKSTKQSATENPQDNTKTTRSWLWTVDADYGTPTRHRRETEDTLSPLATRSTTGLSIKEVYEPTTEASQALTMNSSLKTSSQSTLEASVTNATAELPKQETGAAETYTATSVETPKTEEAVQEETEYTAAINQGQLFGIIENGTLFDIIELSENVTEGVKKKLPSASTTHVPENLFTTVMYHKEPTAESDPYVTKETTKTDTKPNVNYSETNKSSIDKNMHKQTNINDLTSRVNDKSLSKEVEMYPIATNSLVKLNRTNRKELPMVDANSLETPNDKHTFEKYTFEYIIDPNAPIAVEKRTPNTAAVTTTTKQTLIDDKIMDALEDGEQNRNISEIPIHNASVVIDPKIEDLNANVSETFESLIPATGGVSSREYRPENVTHAENSSVTNNSDSRLQGVEPTQPVPEEPKRPNRKRQLTKPSNRSFYPYFFSRVLG